MYYNLFLYLPGVGHWLFLNVSYCDKSALNIYVQVCVWIYAFIYSAEESLSQMLSVYLDL